MSHTYKISIQTARFKFPRISSFTLESGYDHHHNFQIFVPLTTGLHVSDFQDLLGEAIQIKFGLYNSFEEHSGIFIGFIDEVKIDWNDRGERFLLVQGYSPTVFLDCGSPVRGFAKTSAGDIADQLLRNYNGISFEVSSAAYQQKIDWALQHQESDYNFLKRLADQTAVQEFYYDGTKLIFSDLTKDQGGDITLSEGENLEHLTVSLNTSPQRFSLRAYDYTSSKDFTAQLRPLDTQNRLLDVTLKKSSCYKEERIYLPHTVDENVQTQLDRMARRMAATQANDLLQITGRTSEPRLKIGSQITIDASEGTLDDILDFIVVEVNHHYQEPGRYSNSFVAVPAGLPFNLRMSYRMPQLSPMAAKVTQNNDPKKLDRVKVKFFADQNQCESPWLRVLRPYSAFGGFHALPQKGDYVMVQGEGDHPEWGMMVLGSFCDSASHAKHWPDRSMGFHSERCGLYIEDQSGKIIIYGDDLQLVSRKSMSLDAQRIDLASGKGQIPQK